MGPLSLSALLSKRELWRVATYQLAFSSAGELVVGILLLYTLRQFERHWGSRKFGAFIVISKLVSFVTSSSALLCWRGGSAAPPLAAGPYGKPNVRVESASSTCVVDVYACIHVQTPRTHTPTHPGIIFAGLVQFHFDIPVSVPMSIFGLRFSDKTLTYLLAAQAFVCVSVPPCLCTP